MDASPQEYLELYRWLCASYEVSDEQRWAIPSKPLLSRIPGFHGAGGMHLNQPAPRLRKVFIDHAYSQNTGLGIRVQLLLEKNDGIIEL
jgi:hypothetical protein